MSRYWVELSEENRALALAEVAGAVAALGGRSVGPLEAPATERPLLEVELADRSRAVALGHRLALARRVLEPWEVDSPAALVERFRTEGGTNQTAAVRPLGRPGARLDSGTMDACARAYRDGGGRIDLVSPERRFFFGPERPDGVRVAEEVARVDRRAFGERRMPSLPFRRPVSLPPKLGRVAVNLAAVRPGDRVVDPFVGTGALLLEAALLGARVSGIDREAAMVRGAIQNFAHAGLEFERLVVADAGSAADSETGAVWDALVTDPPYGRSSGSGGEPPADLVARVLPRWAAHLRPAGRVVVVLPGGPDPLPAPWVCVSAVRDRVHRSLTREFRTYQRSADQ